MWVITVVVISEGEARGLNRNYATILEGDWHLPLTG